MMWTWGAQEAVAATETPAAAPAFERMPVRGIEVSTDDGVCSIRKGDGGCTLEHSMPDARVFVTNDPTGEVLSSAIVSLSAGRAYVLDPTLTVRDVASPAPAALIYEFDSGKLFERTAAGDSFVASPLGRSLGHANQPRDTSTQTLDNASLFEPLNVAPGISLAGVERILTTKPEVGMYTSRGEDGLYVTLSHGHGRHGPFSDVVGFYNDRVGYALHKQLAFGKTERGWAVIGLETSFSDPGLGTMHGYATRGFTGPLRLIGTSTGWIPAIGGTLISSTIESSYYRTPHQADASLVRLAEAAGRLPPALGSWHGCAVPESRDISVQVRQLLAPDTRSAISAFMPGINADIDNHRNPTHAYMAFADLLYERGVDTFGDAIFLYLQQKCGLKCTGSQAARAGVVDLEMEALFKGVLTELGLSGSIKYPTFYYGFPRITVYSGRESHAAELAVLRQIVPRMNIRDPAYDY